MKYELGIVIPIQENSNLDKFLTDISLVLIKNSINATITIVASDLRFHLAVSEYENLQKRYLLNLNCITSVHSDMGYGRLIRLGIANTLAKYILVIFPNQAMDPNQIPELLVRCRSGSTLVNRFSSTLENQNLRLAKIMQVLFRQITTISIGRHMPTDSTYAFRIFDKSVYEYLAISGNSWDMLAEQTVKTVLAKSRVENLDSKSLEIPSSKVKFSYFGNFWGYSRIVLRGFLHRTKVPWF